MTQARPFESYDAAIQYLYRRINYEQTTPPSPRDRQLSLMPMQRLLERLGNPQTRLPVVHIAGTKGKGSTAALVSSVLTRAGYRTGLYTSPHLTRLEERYAVDGVACSVDELVQLAEAVHSAANEVDEALRRQPPHTGITFFEITTAMAWLYFLEKRVDLAVIEVGLGGRLDSTNLCQPLVTVITSISYDHMKQLGNTLAAIAGEKAGIIKPGTPVVSGVVAAEARAVVEQVARENQSTLYSLGRDFDMSNLTYLAQSESSAERVEFDYVENGWGPARCLRGMGVGLLGEHQARNAAVALAALTCLDHQGWPVPETAARLGLAEARCPGRIEVVHRQPTVILDTAHNVASAAALVETLGRHFVADQKVLLFATSRDKDVAGILHVLLPAFDRVVLTQFVSNPRAMAAKEVREVAQQVLGDPLFAGPKPMLECYPTPGEAWSQLRPTLRPRDLACITGSFFLAGEMRAILE